MSSQKPGSIDGDQPRLVPSFVVVGVARGGTTSLHYYLHSQRGITMSATKEPNFFALKQGGRDLDLHPDALDQLLKSSVTDRSSYEKLFDEAHTGDLLGDASPLYLYSPSAAAEIFELVPGAKVIVLLRDPVDRAFSSYLRRAGSSPTIGALEAELEREEAAEGTGTSMHPVPLIAGGLYSPQLTRYLELFDPESIWVGLSEMLWDDTRAQLGDIWEFLEPPANTPTGELPRFNASGRVKNVAVDTLVRRPAATKRFLKRHAPGTARRLVDIKHRIQRWNSDDGPNLPAATHRAIFERYFEDDVRTLDTLVQLDLSRWGP